MSDTLERLLVLAADRFDVHRDDLSADGDFFESLGIDSVQALELLTDLETTFDVEIPDYEMQGVVTFKALATLVDKRR